MHAASYCGETECVAALIQAGKTMQLTTPFPYLDKSTGHNVCTCVGIYLHVQGFIQDFHQGGAKAKIADLRGGQGL